MAIQQAGGYGEVATGICCGDVAARCPSGADAQSAGDAHVLRVRLADALPGEMAYESRCRSCGAGWCDGRSVGRRGTGGPPLPMNSDIRAVIGAGADAKAPEPQVSGRVADVESAVRFARSYAIARAVVLS